MNFLYFKIHGVVWDISLIKISYKLTKRQQKLKKQIENSLKILKMNNIINFKTIRNIFTASVSFLRLLKELKSKKKHNQREECRSH